MIVLFGSEPIAPAIDAFVDVASASDVRTFIIPCNDHDDGDIDRSVIGASVSHEICGDFVSFRCFLSFLFDSA